MENKIYKCICGREFTNSQAFNGHKSNCKEHQIQKYGSLDFYKTIRKQQSIKSHETQRKQNELKAEEKKLKNQEKLEQWISEQHTCEKCGKVMTEYYGSGRYCSRKCANSRNHSDETKEKISESLCNTYKERCNFQNSSCKEKLLNHKNKKLQEYINRINEIENSDFWSYVVYDTYDFDNLYAVNKLGQIMNVKTGKYLKPFQPKNNYRFYVLMQKNKIGVELPCHRIVAKAFLPNPDNLPCVNHKDENKENNCVDNLEWCTWSYNNTYNDVHKKRGEKLRRRKLSEEHKDKLRKVKVKTEE